MDLNLKDKVALVTGAAGGIGRETAFLLAEEGARVIVSDMFLDEARKVEDEIKVKGGSAVAIKGDVVNYVEVSQMIEEVLKTFAKIDILINNAGIFPAKPIREMPEEDFDKVIAVNLKGVYNCTRAVVNHMIERRYGRIVSLSSTAGKVGSIASVSHYAAAKAGVMGFTKSIARELGEFNITANAVAPGPTDTPMLRGSRETIIEKAVKASPLGRLGHPREIANMIVFLASDAASFMTGEVVTIDGGWTMC